MPRRGDNIRKRKDGRWEARYLMPVDATGDRRYGSVYGRSYQEAKEKRDSVLTHPQVVQASTQLRVKDLLYAWQDSNRIRLKESSVSRYQNLIDTHILPYIGSLNVGMLTTPYLNKFIGTKLRNGRVDGKGGLSPSYVRSIALYSQTILAVVLKTWLSQMYLLRNCELIWQSSLMKINYC